MPSWKILQGNCLEVLRQLPDRSVQTLVTSPPYYALRDYGGEAFTWGGMSSCSHEWGEELPGSNRGGSGTPTSKNNRGEGYGRAAARGAFCQRAGCGAWNGALGLEPTPELFVHHLVLIFREARRVLRDDGTAWINMGDSYNNSGSSRNGEGLDGDRRGGATGPDGECGYKKRDTRRAFTEIGIKHKDLMGVPWMMAFALRADGWYLRSEIIWHKPSPMPESVRDRPTKAHEHIFLFAKSVDYYYDLEAIREEPKADNGGKMSAPKYRDNRKGTIDDGTREQNEKQYEDIKGANARSVWTIATKPFAGAHFAVFPPKLPERCILAGTSERGACATCGSPWERVIAHPCEKCEAPVKHHAHSCEKCGHVNDWKADREAEEATLSSEWDSKGKEVPSRTVLSSVGNEDLGWAPTCSCGTQEVVPCVVIDIFNGSGTTGEAALKNGRNYIGIEQNPEFIKLAKARLIGSAKEDLRAGDFVFCPGCEKKGETKMFERAAVEKSRAEGRKITCPKCLGRYTAEALGVLA